MHSVKEKFLRYVTFDTKSSNESTTYPSTQTQIEFAKILVEECKAMGLSDVKLDENGYVTAALPANTDAAAPVIGFFAHMDTSPSFSGKDVKPQVIANYDGKDIVLKNGVVLSPDEFTELKSYVGKELITTDGTTLLGADNKAGVAEILAAMEYLLAHPEVRHGKIRVAFTPDEEVGHGVDKFNIQEFGADFAYTIDGGKLGELESESFNAAKAKITIKGKSVHPGYAYGIMINAAQIGAEYAAGFPENETPATTKDFEGYYHLTSFSGDIEQATLEYIIRDFDRKNFEARKDRVLQAAAALNEKYGKEILTVELQEQYFNMSEILKDKQEIIKFAEKAMQKHGITPIQTPIRGGTDGARLTFSGLPCPNIFTGGHNFHGPYEYIVVESMVKAVEVIVSIASLDE